MAQIPVVGWLKRHITPKECAKIQDFDVDGILGTPFVLGESDQQAQKIVERRDNAVKLESPNKVEYESGKNWGDINE